MNENEDFTDNTWKRLRSLENKWQDTLLEELKELNKTFSEHQMQDIEKRGEGRLECIRRITELRNILDNKIDQLDIMIRNRCEKIRREQIDPLQKSVTILTVKVALVGGLGGMIGGAIVGTVISLLITGALK